MIELAIMIEGQDGLNWPRWQGLARTVEDVGFAGLYRSDHFTNSEPPDIDALDMWASLTWLASHTQRIEFGPLVIPFSVRHPANIARTAAAIDDLSGGRLTLGVGAGWQEREHTKFGFDLLDIPGRMNRFAEGLEVVSQLLHSDEPVNYAGKFYNLREATLLPRPARPGGPPLLVGGGGQRRTLPLAAQYAKEWNCAFITPAKYAERNQRLSDLLAEQGRQPSEIKRSFMTGLVFGRDTAEVERKLQEQGTTREAEREHGVVVGTPAEVVEQLGVLAEAGVQRAMLQWSPADDLTRLEAFGKSVLPQL